MLFWKFLKKRKYYNNKNIELLFIKEAIKSSKETGAKLVGIRKS